MCCFSGKVVKVWGTRIFARMRGERQVLVYQMGLSAAGDLAMILPLPVAPGSGVDAVRFTDLSAYPEFFEDLERSFLGTTMLASRGGFLAPASIRPPLVVHQVGSFEASYVPTVRDFDRLDPRFRLPAQVWDDLPEYRDYGFAVFKLKSGEHKIHPMAFDFPARRTDELFFPTVHIHDQLLHRYARFDHVLYCQGSFGLNSDWTVSNVPLRDEMKTGGLVSRDRTQGLVDGQSPGFRHAMKGTYENRDVRVPLKEAP